MTVFAPGNTAVITGGASGIGLALARTCYGRHGMHVVIADCHGAHLARAKESIVAEGRSGSGSGGSGSGGEHGSGGGSVETVEMDVARLEEFEKIKAKTTKIDLLVLNAGIALKGDWTDSAYFHRVLDVNLFGVIHGLNALLPLVTTSPNPQSQARSIIITGSKQGITNPPGNPAYNASKAAIRSLAEHLAYDLSSTSPSTSVHLLVPGWTFTGLSGNEPFPDEPSAAAAAAASETESKEEKTEEQKEKERAKGKRAQKEKPPGAWTPAQVVDFLQAKMAQGAFYVLCPDNDVSEDLDRRRMLWAANEAVQGRAPLSRWREETRGEAEEWMKNVEV